MVSLCTNIYFKTLLLMKYIYIYIYIFFYIKILIYNITHETKKSQSPGTENLRCLGIQKKERKRKKKKLI